jgi:uncharacterized membrane protein
MLDNRPINFLFMTTVRNFLLKPWLYIVVILFGALLKFHQLNSKLFWVDEISTVFYTAGINGDTIQKSLPINQIEHFSYYDSLLHLSTKPYSLKHEVTGILSDTHLTPAHYVFLTLWYRLVGDNNMDYRLFSVFIFILSLPFIFLLAKLLFDSPLGGWIATSLFAVSPFINTEAQEARYYMLWVFFFILTNYLFLQALKRNGAIRWVWYSAAAVLALYTSLTSGAFIFGHLVYIFLFKKELRVQFSIALLFVFLAYLPWMHFLFTVRDTIESGLAWHKRSHSPYFSLDLLFFQLLGFVRSFIFLYDTNLYGAWFNGNAPQGIYSALLIDLIFLALITYSVFYLFTKTSKEIRWLLILIVLPLLLFLYISDIIRDGFTSILWRYQIVNMAGIILIVAKLLNDKIAKGKWLYIAIYFVLVFSGVASILKIAATRCWNTSPDCEYRIEESELISAAAHPLIITDFTGLGNFDRSLSVLNDCKATKADILYCKGTIPNITEKIAGKAYSDIYVFAASDSIVQQIKSQFGKTMLPFRKAPTMFAPQIWQIKF